MGLPQLPAIRTTSRSRSVMAKVWNKEDVQAYPQPRMPRPRRWRMSAGLPGCRRLRHHGAVLQQDRDRARRLDLDHRGQCFARHPVGRQRAPEDPVGRSWCAIPTSKAARAEGPQRQGDVDVDHDRPKAPSSIRFASTITRRRCSRRLSSSTSAGWSSTPPTAPFICQSQSSTSSLPADVHKRDLHQIHMMAWKRGVRASTTAVRSASSAPESVAGEALAQPLGDLALSTPIIDAPRRRSGRCHSACGGTGPIQRLRRVS